MYAVIKTGGKQYKVASGQTVEVEKLDGKEGEAIELGDVLLVADGEKVIAGNPTIEGAKVKGTILEHGKGKKVIVFKYKPKVRYRRKRGHRQLYTKLAIEEIVVN